MCGVLGVVGPASESVDVAAALGSLEHRGRDHVSIRRGPGYCRLAIRGVGSHDADGHQPFTAAGESWLCYGVGEIYNATQLRQSGGAVLPDGDIGALLATYLRNGALGLADVVGEFAVVLYDVASGRLALGTDHLGTRSLFVARRGGSLYFASEAKGLAALGVALRPDRCTVASHLRYCYPLAPRTWYEDVELVPAGSLLRWHRGRCDLAPYADIGSLAAEQCDDPIGVDEVGLRRVLTSAVRSRLRSDVPIGQHLSGGLDSSLVAHLAGAAQLRAYTVDYAWDQSTGDGFWAGEVARQVGLEWCPVPLGADEPLSLVREAIRALDGPLMSPGALTPYLVARAAAHGGVKVLLQGQGSDEVFLGYARFRDIAERPEADVAAVAANVDRSDLLAVAPALRAELEEAERTVRRNAAVPSEHPAAALLQFQVAYLRLFLRELLRIEDQLHLAWTVENRPPFLDRDVVRVGLAMTARDPAGALGKPLLRRLLVDLGSRAGDRAEKQQMTIPLAAAADWAARRLGGSSALDLLPSFDHHAIRQLARTPTTPSRQRLLWAGEPVRVVALGRTRGVSCWSARPRRVAGRHLDRVGRA